MQANDEEEDPPHPPPEDDAAAAAAAALTATLAQWTSPKLGTVRILPKQPAEDNPEAWLMQQDDDDDENNIQQQQQPKTKLQRANTPIISNSSRTKKKQQQQQMIYHKTPAKATTLQQDDYDEEEEEEDTEIPFNVESPWVSATTTTTTTSPGPTTSPIINIQTTITPAIVRRSRPSGRSSHTEYRRYHDTLQAFLRAHKQNNTGGDSSSQALELEFLRKLHMVCFDTNNNANSSREANVWWLLHGLRKIGLAALLWADDAASQNQHAQAVSAFVSTLASVSSTNMMAPADLVAQFLDNNDPAVPLALRRRRQVLTWLEQCFQNTSSTSTRALRTRKLLDNNTESKLSQSLLYETDKDGELLEACLELVLQGRLDDALQLARDSNVAWRAALWGGGTPQGFSGANGSNTATGNARRALWKRMLWRHAETLHNSTSNKKNDDEVAIAALLSSHLKVALDTTSLRTFEKGLYTAVKANLDRLLDDLLHQHNHHRRRAAASNGAPPFPGTEHEQAEIRILHDTADVATALSNEAAICRMLDSSPFEILQGRADFMTAATAAFVSGQSAIREFMERSRNELLLFGQQEPPANHDVYLRFATHLALYLDSLAFTSTPVVLEGVVEWKNDLLLAYIRHLASREDLWYMLVLYASILPVDVMLEELPVLLSVIESPDERKVLVEQLEEFLPSSGLALQVLRRVVYQLLSVEEEQQDADDPMMVDRASSSSLPTTTRLDVIKMKAVLWLCFDEAHAGEALIAANALLRQFLLADKVNSAIAFVDDILPEKLLGDVDLLHSDDVDDDDGDAQMTGTSGHHQARVEDARAEHSAYLSYMEAAKAVEDWKAAIADTNPIAAGSSEDEDMMIDKTQLNATEASIAASMERRKLIEDKRTTTQVVIVAADNAQNALNKILEHPGGWLLTEDEVAMDDADSDDETVRRADLEQLRKKLLPGTVMLYHDVCVETATWLSKCLDDAIDKIDGERMDGTAMVKQISEMSSAMENSSESPISPRYWTQKALSVAPNIESERYCIESAFRTADYKELMSRLAETCVSDQLYLSYGF